MDLKRPTHVIGLWAIATMAGQAITGFGVCQHRHRHQRVMRHQSGGGKNGRWVVDIEVLWWSVHGTAHCIEMQQNPLRPSYIPPLTACEWGVHGPPPGPPSPQPQNGDTDVRTLRHSVWGRIRYGPPLTACEWGVRGPGPWTPHSQAVKGGM